MILNENIVKKIMACYLILMTVIGCISIKLTAQSFFYPNIVGVIVITIVTIIFSLLSYYDREILVSDYNLKYFSLGWIKIKFLREVVFYVVHIFFYFCISFVFLEKIHQIVGFQVVEKREVYFIGKHGEKYGYCANTIFIRPIGGGKKGERYCASNEEYIDLHKASKHKSENNDLKSVSHYFGKRYDYDVRFVRYVNSVFGIKVDKITK